MNRRNYLALMGAAAGAIATSSKFSLVSAQDPGAPTTSTVEDRARRMKWWHEAKFGMFIHWGLYSTLGRHEWVMENEGIPAKEYEQYANNFRPKPNFATAWAQLAKRAEVWLGPEVVRVLLVQLQAQAKLRHRVGPASETRRHEVHGDDHQT